uniref:Uncharacterized protein n=1 Tax=viral metagenome TaxID=1070528 RepID=A0A6C0B216_9ZZZZ
MQGGTLFSDAAFKKILSLGYEFETSDLAKMSLHDNKRTLVNSDLSLRLLKEKIQRGSIKVVDGNYLHVRIPIAKKGQVIETVLTEEDDEDTLEFLRQMQEEEPEEYEKEMQAKREKQAQALIEMENDSYLEYFNENRKTDNPDVIKFQITNDLGDTMFGEMLKAHCKELTIPKNDMFLFKTNKDKIYKIKFSEDIAKNEYCESFSGVEFVVTYYNPKKDNANIVLDTFVDACSRIVDHFGDLKTIKGTLMSNDNQKTHYVPIGAIGNERNLYRKPNTNLFYMDTYDDENVRRLKNYGDAEFIPQMTFRCKAADAIDIMKEILRDSPDFKSGTRLLDTMSYDFLCLEKVDKAVHATFAKYNETAEHKIELNTVMGKNLRAYMFLIYFKLYMFIINHAKIFSKKDYLKDHLVFASRHPNIELYERIKQILKQHFNLSSAEKTIDFLCYSEALKILYEPPTEDEFFDEDDFEEDGTYKYNGNAHSDVLEEYQTNFGNPLYSMKSYFEYMERKEEDWLKAKKLDVFSTTFELKNDEILLENRSFRFAIELYLRNKTNVTVTKDALTVKDMHKIVTALYGKKSIKRMMTLSKHPSKQTLTKKSKSKSALKPTVLAQTQAKPTALQVIKEVSKEEDLSPTEKPFEPIPLDLVPDIDHKPLVPAKPIGPPSRLSRRIKPPKQSHKQSRSKRGSKIKV